MSKLPLVAAVAALCASFAQADEGMWLFSNPPLQQLKTKYGFQPSAEWLESVQKSAVRFNNGGSGSFVSANGLTLTNHHVASECLAQLSTQQKDILKSGFLAASQGEERTCPGLELNVLMETADVTDQVNAAVKAGLSEADAEKARRAVMNQIEKDSLEKSGLRSDVVMLYNGGQYHLYKYKRYTDVRLVFAPEASIAFFGGDPDNFEFPRYNLDMTLVRVYEDNKPARLQHYLKWNIEGPGEGDLVFVAGHPGRTSRLHTVAQLEFLRDYYNPTLLIMLRRRELMLTNWSQRSAENARRADDDLKGYANSRKAYLGMLAGLQSPDLMRQKRTEQEKLRSAVQASPELKAQYGTVWDDISSLVDRQREIYPDYLLWEGRFGFNSTLFTKAQTLVRLADESQKPNAERLRAYSDAALPSLKLQLFSEEPIYKDLEILKLADSLSMLMETAGAEHPLVQKVLAGKSPGERAAQLVNGTSLENVAARKKLAEGGLDAIQQSNDPMIELARLIDPQARKLRKALDETIVEPLRQASGKLAQARFAVLGSGVYPDATFTLRLAFGEVKGYTDQGQQIPWKSTLAGGFARAADHNYKEPFDLPESWKKGKDQLDLNTPFNFVSTPDIIGGNSGSPVINRAGELVGLIFDGNAHSLQSDYRYTDEQARAVSVHSAAMLEVLRKIYDADAVVSELSLARN